MCDDQYSIICLENSDFVDYLVKSIKCQWHIDDMNGTQLNVLENYKLNEGGTIENERTLEFPRFSGNGGSGGNLRRLLDRGKIRFNSSIIDFGEYDFGDRLKTIEF
jgi:hypothetical protein